MATAAGVVRVGVVRVVCPECEVEVPCEVTAELVPADVEGRVNLECRPDMTDLWAHVWAHTDGE